MSKLDNVQIIRELFCGGMANLSLGLMDGKREVVYRELIKTNKFKLRNRKSFINGCKIRKELSDHPNIVHSIENDSSLLGLPYEIIEFIPGQNIKRMILADDAILHQHQLDIIRQMAAGLAHVHSKGYIHLDIKAENYLINPVSEHLVQVKLTDFDLSFACTEPKKLNYKSGTAAYMAPEQLKSGIVGPSADIFAFGITCYYMTTGKMPFSGDTEKEVRNQQMSSSYKITEPISINPDIKPKVNDIIMQCLEKDPEKRFPNMGYLCKALGETLAMRTGKASASATGLRRKYLDV